MGKWTIAAAVTFCLAGSICADAQIVRVGPGGSVEVRAPFTRVFVGPGGTSVRAPFTAVDTPRFRWGRVEYALPEPDQLARYNWQQLREHLRASADLLDRQLADMREGADWRSVLKPGLIRDLVSDDVNRPPDAATAKQLGSLLAEYDAVAADRSARRVVRLAGFGAVHTALREFTTPPLARQGNLLSYNWSVLNEDLRRFRTGGNWQDYLKLPQQVVGSGTGDVDLAALEKALQRYDKVGGDPKYRTISRLESFQATHASLTTFVELFQEPQDAPIPPAVKSDAEEIPAPKSGAATEK